MAAKKLKSAPDLTEMLDTGLQTLAQGMKAAQGCIDRVSDMLDSEDEYDDRKASHLAFMLEKLARVSNELRQLEKHERHMSKSPEARFRLVRAYLRELDSERLAIVRADIAEMGAGSVLS